VHKIQRFVELGCFIPNLKFVVFIGMVIVMVKVVVKAIEMHFNMAILSLTKFNWDVDAIL